MKVIVFGAGYVGTVSAACLAKLGHQVTLVDTVASKVEAIQHGRSPVVEPGLDALVAIGVAQGLLRAERDGARAALDAEVAMVCVGTPCLADGSVDVSALHRVLQTLAAVAVHRPKPLLTVIRSTILAPVLRQVLADTEPREGVAALQVVVNPEFMRETSAISDFFHPPFLVAGSDCPEAMDLVFSLYDGIQAPRCQSSLETASLLKYACNAFHALKIAFANEVDTLANLIGAQGDEVMKLLALDKTLNLSRAYLKPGFAFGGSCLPKDLRALTALSHAQGEPLTLLSAVLPSNQRRLEQALELLAASGRRRLAIIGLSFKAGSDDLRESPYVELVERLLAQQYQIRIYDPDLKPERLFGANRAQVLERLPQLAGMLVDSPEAVCAEVEAVVLCKRRLLGDLIGTLARCNLPVYDLESMQDLNPETAGHGVAEVANAG